MCEYRKYITSKIDVLTNITEVGVKLIRHCLANKILNDEDADILVSMNLNFCYKFPEILIP